MPVMDFSFIADAQFKKIIERDYEELQRLNPEAAPKSVLILAGGIIEGLLIDALIKSGQVDGEGRVRELPSEDDLPG